MKCRLNVIYRIKKQIIILTFFDVPVILEDLTVDNSTISEPSDNTEVVGGAKLDLAGISSEISSTLNPEIKIARKSRNKEKLSE